MCSGWCSEDMPKEERWLDVCGGRGSGGKKRVHCCYTPSHIYTDIHSHTNTHSRTFYHTLYHTFTLTYPLHPSHTLTSPSSSLNTPLSHPTLPLSPLSPPLTHPPSLSPFPHPPHLYSLAPSNTLSPSPLEHPSLSSVYIWDILVGRKVARLLVRIGGYHLPHQPSDTTN